MDDNGKRLTWVEKMGSTNGRSVNLAELREGTYDVAVYQKGGEAGGFPLRGLSLEDIRMLFGNVDEGRFYICSSNKPRGRVQWD